MYHFKDFYKKNHFSYSFEVFPVKTEKGLHKLLATLKDLSEFNPSFISVTYGAMGSTRSSTEDLAIKLHDSLHFPVAFHFTCVGSNKEEIKNYVEKLKSKGLNLVVALRGDRPENYVDVENGLSYASELVSFLKNLGDFSMAVAGYPEVHIEAENSEKDLDYLKQKVDAGADVIITQLFFDNQLYYDFVDRARKIGIKVPIVPGIMPIINLKQIEKITSMCGASIPEKLHQSLKDNEADLESIKKIGLEHAIRQCQDLKSNGVPGIHFYTLNQSEIIRKIISSL